MLIIDLLGKSLMPRPLRVFLCYASQDKPVVRDIYNALKMEGWIDPWLDKAKILPGQNWEIVIEKAVDESDVVIVCLSGQAITKEGFVQREIRYAYDIALEKPDETIFLIPLRLDDCNVPRKLRTFHWVDYFGDYKENAYSNLLDALRLRYDQKLHLEVEEAERRQIEEKSKREAAEREKIELAWAKQDEKEKREISQPQEPVLKPTPVAEKKQESVWKPTPKMNLRNLGIGGIIFASLLLAILGGNYFYKNINSTLTESPATHTATKTKTLTPAPTKTFTPTPGIGSTMIDDDGMTLVYVPKGKFTMGSENGNPGETPHEVFLDSFWVDKTEVTTDMFRTFVEQENYTTDAEVLGWSVIFDGTYWIKVTGVNWEHPRADGNVAGAKKPVSNVSWNDAMAYCNWAGRRLPTEAEWEKAARGIDGRMYPWGNTSPNSALLNYANNVGDSTEVGSYPAGASYYGALDMAGNLWEWVYDWYDEDYYKNNIKINPQGPDAGELRVLRGGAWLFGEGLNRSSYREKSNPLNGTLYTGFRCVKNVFP